ncbi:MAG TPA: T9SS type A sorting domain-containing protein [Candidatus Kapabacteria bacterium]|nr:T9SS type A sorting domain-containing protein [Candidatus Kapabacteria bacterium]
MVLFLAWCAPSAAHAQSGAGSQDSLAHTLRPRWGTYIVGVFPSPARAGQLITVQTYNHTSIELSLKVYDMSGRDVLDLLPQQTMPAGLQTRTISPFQLSSGAYLVKLVTYTASGATDIVDEAHFLIAH